VTRPSNNDSRIKTFSPYSKQNIRVRDQSKRLGRGNDTQETLRVGARGIYLEKEAYDHFVSLESRILRMRALTWAEPKCLPQEYASLTRR